MSSRRWRMWCAVSLLGAVVGAVGCAADGGSTNAPESAGEAAQAVSAKEEVADGDPMKGALGRHGRPGPGAGGPEMVLFAALHELELTDAQKTTIQGAVQNLRPEKKERGQRDGGPFAALAAGVRAGKIDPAVVLATTGGPDRAGEDRGAAVAAALQTLHATLTKEQRVALVDVLAKKMDEHGPKDGPPGEGRKGDHGPRGERGARGPLGHLLEELDLTAAQETAIDSALAAQRPAEPDHEAMKKGFEAMRAGMRARLQSFAADSFDAKAFVAPPDGPMAGGPKEHLERMVKDFAVVVPILQPAQRETLAALLEKGPPGPMGPRGRHGNPDR